jgi:hypothetical protein
MTTIPKFSDDPVKYIRFIKRNYRIIEKLVYDREYSALRRNFNNYQLREALSLFKVIDLKYEDNIDCLNKREFYRFDDMGEGDGNDSDSEEEDSNSRQYETDDIIEEFPAFMEDPATQNAFAVLKQILDKEEKIRKQTKRQRRKGREGVVNRTFRRKAKKRTIKHIKQGLASMDYEPVDSPVEEHRTPNGTLIGKIKGRVYRELKRDYESRNRTQSRDGSRSRTQSRDESRSRTQSRDESRSSKRTNDTKEKQTNP